MENRKKPGIRLYTLLYALLVGCLLLPNALSGQDEKFERDSLQAEQYYAEAMEWKEKAMVDTINTLAFFDTTIFLAKKSAEIFADLELWEKWYDSNYVVFNGLLSVRKYEEFINYLQYISDSVLPKANNLFYNAKINGWFGYFYYYTGVHDQALKHYLIEAKILDELGNPNGLHGQYASIGAFYTMNGDYAEAFEYLQRAKTIHLPTQNKRVLESIYWNLGKYYWTKANFDKSIESYTECLKYGANVSNINVVLGEVYRDKGELNKAMEFAKRALNEFVQKKEETQVVEFLIGSIYQLKGDYDSSILYYNKALKNYQKAKSKERNRREIGKIYLKIGDVYFGTNQLLLALEKYQNALQEFLTSFKDSDVKVNPAVESFDLAYGLWVMEALDAKGKVFQKQYAQNNNPNQLEYALDCYEAAFKTIDFLRYHQKEEDSKIDLINYAHPIYEQAIHVTLSLYKLTSEEEYLNKAFAFSQRTKAFLIGAALQNVNALEKGGVPDSLIQKEEELKAEILGLKNNEKDAQDKMILDSLAKQRFIAKRNLEKLKDHLEQNYPEYYHLKYEDKIASIADIRYEVLERNVALIDYFLGDSTLFVLTITNEKVHLEEIKRTEYLDHALSDCITQVKSPDFTIKPNIAYQEYTESAYFLFQTLLEKSLAEAGTGINQLIIIPDGILNTLPFGALLMERPDDSQISYSFEHLSYFIEEYTVNVHYAPQVLLEQNRQLANRKAIKLFGGFAPDFSKNEIAQVRNCSESNLSGLKYNRQEVEAISQQLEGDPYLNEQATAQAFKDFGKDYRILHFATHACMNEEDPMKHKIYFAEEEFLTAVELFNLPLQAEMVVLSACETGIGKIVKGEGVMNLARGFSYKGCPSVIMSLWSVPDKAASEIMIDFYHELYSGSSKDQALRAAKLKFIKANKSIRHHPYYWAAFVPVGDAGAIDFGQSWPAWIWLLGASALLLMLFFFFKSRRN